MPEKKIDTRGRNFATVVYPESAPPNWLDILKETKIPCFVSPLHDKDVNPTGEPKKAHYHVLACLEGKKSVDQMSKLFQIFGGVGVEQVNSLRGYARYLCHLDNPEKHQYDIKDVICVSGADYNHVIGLASDKHKAIKEMQEFCKSTHCFMFSDLCDYAREYRYDWHVLLSESCTLIMKEYVKSLKFKIDNHIEWEPPVLSIDEDGVIDE